MRRGLLIMLLLLLAGPVWAQAKATAPANVSADDEAAIRGVITRQIDAFGRDDENEAFAIASPHIQQQFGNSARFVDMVRRGYPAVYRPRSVDFAELLLGDDTIVQQVELVGSGGEAELALYSMQRDTAGHWRIDGCTLVRSARAGT